MHGREGEQKKQRRHMLPGPALGTTVADSALDSFCKDGRKISIGDCALFQAGNSPPFVGLIRCLILSKKDNYPKLSVNWLYRPSDIKLSKGILLDAAPNEVFYSFHKDEISAASLLHPCKVTFLRKGVELPPGLSSFVCRRVYDITNKCLWWLSDQDYVDEQQEEVDQLLDKTHLEMHAAVQSGGRSQKNLNGPTSSQQLKPGTENTQNSSTSFPSQSGKSRKRERGEHGLEPIKRERLSKSDENDSGHAKQESGTIKAEIAKISDKDGGLVNPDAVEKLVNLMQLDRVEKKIDVVGRLMLADVIASTDKFECLGRFVQLRGVPVLDDWLQEAHKGKIGDVSSPKESDKSVDELVLALLRALDKLPVNLHALQTCNVGKSVNHLRSHKNLEIQRKARSLVDTWKKRVESEMKMNDAKSGPSQTVSWHGKGFAEVSHGGSRRSGSSELLKSSVTQPSAAKTASSKLNHGESVVKSSLSSPGAVKVNQMLPSVTVNSKASSDLPLTSIKEERSSSSSQSQNNSQSFSGDHPKTAGSAWKEDARSSTAGSVSASRSTASGSRSRKSSNGFAGSVISGVQKETGAVKLSSSSKNAQNERVSQSGSTCERVLDVPGIDPGNSQRLIVRLPNPGRSPARSVSAGTFEDPSIMGSRASSPGISEKHEMLERKTRGKGESNRVTTVGELNTESWQSNDVKDGLGGSDESERSPATVTNEERSRITEEVAKSVEISRGASSPPESGKGVLPDETKLGKSYEPSFSSMNALVESCVKYSEVATASLSAGDDQGMNLLASVAAGEMCRPDIASPVGSPTNSAPVVDAFMCNNNSSKSNKQQGDAIGGSNGTDEVGDNDVDNQCNNIVPLRIVESELAGSRPLATISTPVGGKKTSIAYEKNEPSVVEEERHSSGVGVDSGDKPHGTGQECSAVSTSLTFGATSAGLTDNCSEAARVELSCENGRMCGASPKDVRDEKPRGRTPADEAKLVDHACEKIRENGAVGTACDFISGSPGDKYDVEKPISSVKAQKAGPKEGASSPASAVNSMDSKPLPEDLSQHQGLPLVAGNHAATVVKDRDLLPHSGLEKLDEDLKPNRAESVEMNISESKDKESSRKAASVDPTGHDHIAGSKNECMEHTEAVKTDELSSGLAPESEQCVATARSVGEADEADQCISAGETSVYPASDIATKLDFDLNEGISSDEGTNQGDPATLATTPSAASSLFHSSNPLPFSVSLPAPITIAAASKGSFEPPEAHLKGKMELGWKGSAATSAFRPAEPRKILDMPLNSADGMLSDNAAKTSRTALNFDLNVPDERVLDDMATQSSDPLPGRELGYVNNLASVRSSGGLDLDLNRVDDCVENGQLPLKSSCRLEVPPLPGRSSSSGGFPSAEVNVLRDFDLNNGPLLDEVGILEPAQHNQHHQKASMPFISSLPSLRMNKSDLGNLPSWFHHGTPYSAVAIPSFLPDRGGEQPYPIVASNAGRPKMLGQASGGTFGGDILRTPVLSSSASMSFPPAPAAFSYGGFAFSPNFTLASTSFSGGSAFMESSSGGGPCFPTVPSQIVGAAGPIQTHFPRPYVISLPDGGSTAGSVESSRKWSQHGLDLNAGPGTIDMEGRDERMSSVSRQLSVVSSQALAEEQARMYQTAKRKEPDGGWGSESFSYKQASWQ